MNKYVKYGITAALCVAAVGAAVVYKRSAAPEDTAESAQSAAETVSDGKVTKLGEYKGLALTKQSTEVTDEELDAQIQSILDANPEYEEVDRAAQNGDTVNIDYVGMKDGEAFDGGTAEGYDLELGSGSFIDGFEDGLIGARTGDERSLNLTFPEEYGNADLAGQAVVFDVTVNAVKEKHDAVLDDAFVQRVSDFSTVDEFRADTLKDLQDTKESQAEQQLQNDALQAAIDATEFEVNQEAVDQQYNTQREYYTNMVSMYGMELEEYLNLFGMTEDEFNQQLEESADNTVRQRLLVEAIAEAENMEVTDDDRQYVADQFGMELETLKTSYADELDSSALTYKVVRFLVDNAELQ